MGPAHAHHMAEPFLTWLGATPPPAEDNFCIARRFQEKLLKPHMHPSLDSVLEVFLTQHRGGEIKSSALAMPDHHPVDLATSEISHTSALSLPW